MKYWIGALAFVLAGQAEAACKAKDLVGKWVMFQNNITASQPHVGRCTMVVDKNGSFTGSCKLSPPVDIEFPVTGDVAVQPDCNAVIHQKFDGGHATYSVVLSKNKQVFAGQWTNFLDDFGTTTGVKQ